MSKNLILSTTSVVTTLILIEIFIRFFSFAPKIHRIAPAINESSYEYSSNPKLGYVMKKNYKNNHNPDLHESFPKTNNIGFRDHDRKYKKNKQRFILLGDSVVAGHGIREISNLIGPQLEVLLSLQKIEVISMGIGGFCTEGEIELFEQEGLPLSPDKLLLVFVENDYHNLNGQVEHYRIKRSEVSKFLFSHSHLFRGLALRLDLFSYRSDLDPNSRSASMQNYLAENNVKKGLSRLVELMKSHPFSSKVFIWPHFSKSDIIDNNIDANGFLPVEEIAKNLSIHTIRLSVFFQQHWKNNHHRSRSPKNLYTIGDGMHPNEYGAKVAAKIIKQILLNHTN